jgi:hypothetical protein
MANIAHLSVFAGCGSKQPATKIRNIAGSSWMKSLNAISTSHMVTKTPSNIFQQSLENESGKRVTAMNMFQSFCKTPS